jgi:hypothetical protein
MPPPSAMLNLPGASDAKRASALRPGLKVLSAHYGDIRRHCLADGAAMMRAGSALLWTEPEPAGSPAEPIPHRDDPPYGTALLRAAAQACWYRDSHRFRGRVASGISRLLSCLAPGRSARTRSGRQSMTRKGALVIPQGAYLYDNY